MKKDNNSGKNREWNSKRAKSGSTAQRETKKVLAEVVGDGLTTVWAAAMRTWWKECEEASGGGGGPQVGRVTASTVGDRRGV